MVEGWSKDPRRMVEGSSKDERRMRVGSSVLGDSVVGQFGILKVGSVSDHYSDRTSQAEIVDEFSKENLTDLRKSVRFVQ